MKYDITLGITSAEGSQTFRVEADNEEGAIIEFNKNGGEIVSNDVEVQSLEEATIHDVEEV